MSKPFDMELLLTGALTGSNATRLRHLRQAATIQAAIMNRWHRDNPWTWKQKHIVWFLNVYLKDHKRNTHYYYKLTINIISLRLRKSWLLP